jgi:nucleotide-binding universal stress UspA family protein
MDANGTFVTGRELAARAHARLEAIVARQTGAKVFLSHAVTTGQPGEEILKCASVWPASLIMLSTHGRSGFAHFISGSVAEKVLRHARCPLLVLRKHQHDFVSPLQDRPAEATLRRILVPFDFSGRAYEALNHARAIASRFGASITLLHCVETIGAAAAGYFAEVDTANLTEIVATRACRDLTALVEENKAQGIPSDMQVVDGRAGEEIPRVLAAGKVDLIVCSTHAGAPLRHALVGSIAEQLMRHAACPVLVIPSVARDGQDTACA